MKKKDWRGLFRERFVVEESAEEQYLRKYDHRTIVEELEHFMEKELDRAREEGKLELLEELLEWDTPLEPIGKFMRLQTKMVQMKKDLISKLTTK